MTNPALEAFYEKVRSNADLEAQATRALKDGPEALVIMARLEGFEFTEQELTAALSENGVLGEGELSDRDLDLVAGGTVCYAPKLDANSGNLKRV